MAEVTDTASVLPSHASGTSTPTRHPWLSGGPLYAFTLPPELLDILTLRSLTGQADNKGDDRKKAVEDDTAHSYEQTALGCNLCQVGTFESLPEQRAHFSSDWHRFNVKRKLDNKDPVAEDQWDNLVDSLSHSLSGTASSSSEYSSSEEEDADGSTISRVLAKQKLADQSGVNEEETELVSPRSPLLWFEAKPEVVDTQLGIYRTIFPAYASKSDQVAWINELRRMQVVQDETKLGKRMQTTSEPATESSSRTWTLMAVGGGHFAAMVVSLVPRLHNKNGRIEREVVILQSKTYHRYTTRRKQGGAQSTNDQAKGKAKSVGAQLRRANEAQLTEDIRTLLGSWKEQIDSSELVFVRAGKTSHRIFYDYDGAVLTRKDPRIRTFPFPTRRPTQAELVRCFTELTRLKISHLTSEQLEEIQAAYRAAMAPKKPPPVKPKVEQPKAPEVPKLSKEELLDRDRWERVVDMARKGRVEALKNFIDKQMTEEQATKVDWLGRLPSWMQESKASPTLLHVAASNDQPDMVRWLLVDRRTNPTLAFSMTGEQSSDGNGTLPPRTAYECASSKGVRNVFRRVYADHPDWYDWQNDARVPSQLTEEMEAAQNAKENERKNKLKDKLREKAAAREKVQKEEMERAKLEAEQEARRREEERRMSTSTAPRRLGGAAPRAVLEQTQLKGLSEEAKMRIERERRARAAEARLQGR